MKAAKCPNCGANITVDETKDAGICEFCNTAFVTEKAISCVNNTTNNATTIINNYYNTPAPNQTPSQQVPKNRYIEQSVKEPRPKFNFILGVLCWMFGVWPFFIYIFLLAIRKRKWDRKYGIK